MVEQTSNESTQHRNMILKNNSKNNNIIIMIKVYKILKTNENNSNT